MGFQVSQLEGMLQTGWAGALCRERMRLLTEASSQPARGWVAMVS